MIDCITEQENVGLIKIEHLRPQLGSLDCELLRSKIEKLIQPNIFRRTLNAISASFKEKMRKSHINCLNNGMVTQWKIRCLVWRTYSKTMWAKKVTEDLTHNLGGKGRKRELLADLYFFRYARDLDVPGDKKVMSLVRKFINDTEKRKDFASWLEKDSNVVSFFNAWATFSDRLNYDGEYIEEVIKAVQTAVEGIRLGRDLMYKEVEGQLLQLTQELQVSGMSE